MGSIVGSLAWLGLPQAVGRGWELGWSYRLPVQHRPNNMVQARVLVGWVGGLEEPAGGSVSLGSCRLCGSPGRAQQLEVRTHQVAAGVKVGNLDPRQVLRNP